MIKLTLASMLLESMIAAPTPIPTCEERLDRALGLAERAANRYEACSRALEVATSSVAIEPSTPPPADPPSIGLDLDLGSPIILIGIGLTGALVGYAIGEVVR